MAQQRNNEDISYTSDKTFLSLEVVGLAEAVVTRLLHERKSLENIDMVLILENISDGGSGAGREKRATETVEP